MDYDVSNLAAVNFNSTFAGIETADAILIVGSHVRWEAPLVNVRLRKAVKSGAKVFVVGPEWETTYPGEFLGDDLAVLDNLPGASRRCDEGGRAAGDHPRRRRRRRRGAWRGAGAGRQVEARAVTAGTASTCCTSRAARMGALMLGFAQKGGMADLVAGQAQGAARARRGRGRFRAVRGRLKVYIGHHGDKGAHAADIILPAAAYTEKAGTYVNTEGRVQFADKAVFAPGDAREDWTILRALADALGVKVGFDSFDELRAAMIAEVPALGEEGLADYGALPKADSAPRPRARSPIRSRISTSPTRSPAPARRCSAARPNCSTAKTLRRRRNDRPFNRSRMGVIR